MTYDCGAFIWYELLSGDPGKAKAFYDAVVGWTIEADGQTLPTGSTYRMITRTDGGNAGGVLGMSRDMLDHGGRPAWLGYVCVPDVDATVKAFIDAGGAVHMPAMDLPVGRIAMVSDPWGASIYVMAPIPPEGQANTTSDVFSVTEAQHVRWNELWTTDQAGATAFYNRVFGWTQNGSMPMGPMGDYLFLQHGEVGIGAMGPAQPDGEGSRWQYFIGVDDIDRACAAVTEGGGALLGDPQQIPGGEYTVYGHDLEGATFGLVGPRREN